MFVSTTRSLKICDLLARFIAVCERNVLYGDISRQTLQEIQGYHKVRYIHIFNYYKFKLDFS